MTVTYSKLNAIELAKPPHIPVRIDYPDYPLVAQTKEKRGTPPKPVLIAIYRGVDKAVARSLRSRYTGAELRRIRAVKGIGRPGHAA
jgi:hypothetical protein